ncbi:MAG: hypothetical protein IRY87_24550 [Acetobacteraceae bacterium]|nr:hypothetical protein [Acetobacteraceae bacterium]
MLDTTNPSASYSPAPSWISGEEGTQVGNPPGVHATLKIDKLSIIVDVYPADEDLAVPHLVELYGILGAGGAEGIVPASWKSKKGSPAAFHVKLPLSNGPTKFSTANAAIVQLKSRKGGGRYFRVEFHPLGLTPAGFKHVCENMLGFHLMVTPEEILAAKVTRVDIALDLHGVRLQDFVWKMTGPFLQRPWVKCGKLETLYLGHPKHGAACLYDKAKEQGLGEAVAWTRLELRPRPGVPLKALPAMANPWLKVTPYDIRAAGAQLYLPDLHREHALGYAQLIGLPSFISIHPARAAGAEGR